MLQLKVTSLSGEPKVNEADVDELREAGPEVTSGVTMAVSRYQLTVLAALVFPSASLARTASECHPSPETVTLCGLVHAAYAPPSFEQAKEVAPEDEKVIDTGFRLVGVVGCDTVGTGGGVVSTVQLVDAEVLVRYPEATARTANVWLPSLRPLEVTGLVQAEYAAPSKEHWKVAIASVSVNAIDAEVLLVGDVGGVVMVGVGTLFGGAANAGPANDDTATTATATSAAPRP
jgi:hypothetical protein